MRVPSEVRAELVPQVARLVGGRWVPARPEPYRALLTRWRLAFLVLVGKRDVIHYPDGGAI